MCTIDKGTFRHKNLEVAIGPGLLGPGGCSDAVDINMTATEHDISPLSVCATGEHGVAALVCTCDVHEMWRKGGQMWDRVRSIVATERGCIALSPQQRTT